MAFAHGKNGYLAIGTSGAPTTPSDISTYIDDNSLAQKVDAAETTTYGHDAKTYIPGLRDASFSLKGKWDATHDAAFEAVLGLDTLLSFEFGPAGSTSTYTKYSGSCFITEYTTSVPVNDVISWSATIQISGDVTRGTFT